MTQTFRFHMPFDEGIVAAAGRVLVVRPTSPEGLEIFTPEQLTCEQGFRPAADALIACGYKVVEDASGIFDLALVFLTRNRAETLAHIARSLHRLVPGGWLIVDGAKNEGADSILKQLRNTLGVADLRAKAHGKVFWLQRPRDIPDAVSNWAHVLDLAPNADGYFTAPGMFSADGIDRGTALLVQHFDKKLKGRAADFGAGWGGLSAQFLTACPAVTSLDLFEGESSALDAARRNVTDPRAQFHWQDVTALGPDLRYDVIISNPPFHVGRAAEPSLGMKFIAAAARNLSPSGTFLMVANRQLPYEAALDAVFRNWEQVAQIAGFKVIRATRPKTK